MVLQGGLALEETRKPSVPGWDRDCPDSRDGKKKKKTDGTLILGWLSGTEHRQGALAGFRFSQVW